MIKRIFTFILCLLPWYLSNILPLDYKYFDEITKPFFTPPKIFYIISWNIIFILLAISIYKVISSYKLKEIPTSYKITLLLNYIFNQSYTIIFFLIKNNFLAFISCVCIVISTLFLYDETSLLKVKSKYLIIPYILLSIFGTILSLSIYIIN